VTSTRDLRIRFGAELFDQFGGVVRYGPFKGMRLPATSSWSPSDMCPKLLGTYEAEVVETLAALLADEIGPDVLAHLSGHPFGLDGGEESRELHVIGV